MGVWKFLVLLFESLSLNALKLSEELEFSSLDKPSQACTISIRKNPEPAG